MMSGLDPASRSNPDPDFTVSTSARWRSRRRAAPATAVGVSLDPRPAGRGTRVTTSWGRCREAASASSGGTDHGSLPRKVTRRARGPARTPLPLGTAPVAFTGHLLLPELAHDLAPALVVHVTGQSLTGQPVRFDAQGLL